MSSTVTLASINATLANSIANSTIHDTVNTYDYEGAAIYVAVILIWYSAGLALMLFLQVNSRSSQSHFFFDSNMYSKSKSYSSSPFGNYQNIEADSMKKHILNELRDPERRQRLWKIYYSSRENNSEPHPRYYQTITADNVTIGRINRKLADIHRIDEQYRDDSLISPPDAHSDITRGSNKRLISFRSGNTAMMKVDTTRALTPLRSNMNRSNAQGNKQCVQSEQQTTESASTTNRKRNKKLSPNRFTVQKVPENLATSSTEPNNSAK